MLSLFEKLINEHGSSTVLKERLSILKDSYVEIEKARSDLETEKGLLQSENSTLKEHVAELETELQQLKSGALATYVCDYCGSPELKRIGSRPDPTFGDLGVKQKVFVCSECGNKSAFTPEPKSRA